MTISNVYWDASVFHAYFREERGRVDACKQIHEKAQRGEIIIYTSFLTWVECLRLQGRGQPKIPATEEARIQKYFESSFIRPIFLDRVRAELARSLVWKHDGLHPKDSVHVASAISVGLEELHTYDNALIKLSGKIGNPPLKIIAPFIPPSAPPVPTPQPSLPLISN